MTIGLSIMGATGRMGKKVVTLALLDPELKIVGACGSRHSLHIGKDLGVLCDKEEINVRLSQEREDAIALSDVIIDFSLHSATQENLFAALKYKKPIVIGSTGHYTETRKSIDAAGEHIPVLFSPNFSLGMALCIEAAAFFAKNLKNSCYIDIIESHHIQKKDAPSGSSLALAQAVEGSHSSQESWIHSPRPKDTVIIHSIRAGDTIGEHTIIFTCDGEKIELKHQAFSRDAFAKGALKAAKFLAKQPPGVYSFKDILHHG